MIANDDTSRTDACADEWITTKEAAYLLGRPANTLVDWRLRGLGPPYYKYGRVRYLKAEVLAFRASMRGPGRPPRAEPKQKAA